jgi:hypothetical protein
VAITYGAVLPVSHAIMGPNSSHLRTNVANVSARWPMLDAEGLFSLPNRPSDEGDSLVESPLSNLIKEFAGVL